jgi:hypothetical protein
MRRLLFALLAALTLTSSPAQARLFTQPELDALVAPIALYPDGLISDILVAATYPDQVEAAARLPKDAQPDEAWNDSVKQMLSFPDILQRMVDSPQWTRELGEAFLAQEPHVLDTVQALRRRAQTQGTLKSNDQYTVAQEGTAIVVQPRTEVIYAPYYDPYVVYGPWWWPAYRPVYWRPWIVAPVVVSAGFFYARPNWHHRHITVVKTVNHAPVHVHHSTVRSKEYHRVPESHRRPIVSSTPQVHRFDEHRGRGGDQRRGADRQQGRPDAHRSSGHNGPRTQMPAAPRFSEARQPGARQSARQAQAPQQRQAAPQQQARTFAPAQPRTSAPQVSRGGGEMRGNAQRGGGGRGGSSHR